MAVKRGKVTEKVIEKRFSIEVEGEQYFAPKECDPIIGPQLEAFAGQEVEVLMAQDTVLSIRALEPKAVIPLPPIIVCYYVALNIAFDRVIMERIQPLITESLVESGYLDKSVAEKLTGWHEQYG